MDAYHLRYRGAFWFTLGIMIWNWPLMIANAVSFVPTALIVLMKLYYR